MKFIHNFFLLLIIVLAFSCSKKEENKLIIKEKDLELQMIDSYKQGVKALDIGDGITAARKFNEAELLFPQSPWAAKSALMAAYAYYTQDYYSDATYELERFIKTYPKHPDIPYAHFLLGMCFYEQIVDEKKDLKSILDAKKQFELIINDYSSTEFALDSKFKIDLINEVLASKEMYLGKYYLKRKKWIPAINRFKRVINDYETTIYVEEALHRLVETYYHLGLVGESKKYANTLGYNYQSSVWYKNTYRIFNKEYTDTIKVIKKDKKEKKGIIKRFKGLFQ